MMKFKDNNQEQSKDYGIMSKELYNDFIELIQLKIDKIALINSAKFYFYSNGFGNYYKFLKSLYDVCIKEKDCLISHLHDSKAIVPEFNIPSLGTSFASAVDVFRLLANMEDTFDEKLNSLIAVAFDDKNWKTFSYLLKILDLTDHICCRALAAVENKQDVLCLQEQHILEK